MCTSLYCGDFTNPHACCRPGLVDITKYVVCTCFFTSACALHYHSLSLQHTLCVSHLDVEECVSWCLFPCRPGLYSYPMSITLVINLLSQASKSWGGTACLFHFSRKVWRMLSNAGVLRVYISPSFYPTGYEVKSRRHADHGAVSCIWSRTKVSCSIRRVKRALSWVLKWDRLRTHPPTHPPNHRPSHSPMYSTTVRTAATDEKHTLIHSSVFCSWYAAIPVED